MKSIEDYLQPHIRNLNAYSTARDDCSQPMEVYLDANENPYTNGFNRYPSPYAGEVKALLSQIKHLSPARIFTGNGSDEAIDLMFRLFCCSGRDSVVIMEPSYGMYAVAARINNVEVIYAPLGDNFTLDAAALLSKVRPDTRLIFLCSPNNPTGNLLDDAEIERILCSFDGIVVLDEAYIDFSGTQGWSGRLAEYPRLVILQTLSKAWGMAGLRLGMAFAHPVIIDAMNRVKYPYNINILTQRTVCRQLALRQAFRRRVDTLCRERDALAVALNGCPGVVRVFASAGNFLLVRFAQHEAVFEKLLRAGIVVRDRSSLYGCEDCLRISVGTPAENRRLLEVLQGGAERRGFVSRTSRETALRVDVDLESAEAPRIDTGLNFFDHMLEQIGVHSGIALTIDAEGDLATDDHHTVEDTAIALGDALSKALGNRCGIERYGFCLPMDEAQATVLLDLGGRTDFSWNVAFTDAMTGDMHTQQFPHFFKTLAQHLHANLHISASGANDHHIIEAVFKAFARALRAAVAKNQWNGGVPSSKGML